MDLLGSVYAAWLKNTESPTRLRVCLCLYCYPSVSMGLFLAGLKLVTVTLLMPGHAQNSRRFRRS